MDLETGRDHSQKERKHPLSSPMNDKVPESLNIAEQLENKPLRRGVWAEHLANNHELPVGGSLFTDELTIKLKLDFQSFESALEKFTEAAIKERFEAQKADVIDWLNKVGTKIDPYLFFVCHYVQAKMQQLLEVKADALDHNPADLGFMWRESMYTKSQSQLLSETKGKTMCTERSAMGQYLFQRLGMKSAYMGGITMNDAKDTDEFPEAHSFLVIEDPSNQGENYIFDIARPRSQNNLPRVLKPEVPFTYDLLKDRKELLVKAKEVLRGGELYFGVGDTAAGRQTTLGAA
ncbi:MAG: hypothetical protein A2V81_01550 [Candidatus Abawacabacteria bacterium RBG_16_42_10]|uniref:Uncharacterized protein n=1 Tax=Candidatus Abawacabacteria bacterium RBG_16_42_10 TaxID=1817814 RepID=A0A1F4XKJ1_9BACT|nr:MAG: hypothetical protein A2V81_01550 [Candidatus Abawacabacteria bacterium RBG_16_42_10]